MEQFFYSNLRQCLQRYHWYYLLRKLPVKHLTLDKTKTYLESRKNWLLRIFSTMECYVSGEKRTEHNNGRQNNPGQKSLFYSRGPKRWKGREKKVLFLSFMLWPIGFRFLVSFEGIFRPIKAGNWRRNGRLSTFMAFWNGIPVCVYDGFFQQEICSDFFRVLISKWDWCDPWNLDGIESIEEMDERIRKQFGKSF